jgi:membrane protein DedA with SNARE-associated domain
MALLVYLGLASLLCFEEAGVFVLPGDISLVAAGLGASRGQSHLVISWLVATLAMVLGASVLFFLVQRSGRSGRAVPDRVRTLLHRHGAWGVFAARVFPGLRNATVFAAAAAPLRYRTFMLGLVPAAMFWCAALLLAGWFGGNEALSLLSALDGSPLLKALSIGLAACALLWIAYRMRTSPRGA